MSERGIVCADVGGSFIHAALSDGVGNPTRRVRVATPTTDLDAFVAALADIITRYGPGLVSDAPLALSIAGLVDPDTGVMESANIPCITGLPLADLLAQRLGRAVVVANDADCFVVAEALSGAGRGHSIVFGAILGTGIGGGLAVEGRLVRGAGGVTGEWGHSPIVATHTQAGRMVPHFSCGCGRKGCVDTIGGARGIERLDAFLHEGTRRDSHTILIGWQDGEPRAVETLEVYLDLVAAPLALVVNVTGASIVPIGGGLASDLALVKALDLAVRERMLRKSTGPVLVPAVFRADAGLRGAALLALGG